jgi:hypothetical protein
MKARCPSTSAIYWIYSRALKKKSSLIPVEKLEGRNNIWSVGDIVELQDKHLSWPEIPQCSGNADTDHLEPRFEHEIGAGRSMDGGWGI